MMKIGCHCVLFGPAIATDTDRILCDLSKTGCCGVELGARFFSLEKSAELKAALKKNGLVLAGLHTAIPLAQLLDRPEDSRMCLVSAAKAMQEMPERNIIMTGMVENADDAAAGDCRLGEPAQVEEIAARLDRITREIKAEYDVQIHYHNHIWEFQNGGLIYSTLLHLAENLRFCLDTGWAAVAGFDPVSLMQSRPDAFSYIHLRDFSAAVANASSTSFSQLQNTAYTDLGEGDMDYQRLIQCVRDTIGEDGWAVIEYERGAVDYLRYMKAVAYVRGVMEGIR